MQNLNKYFKNKSVLVTGHTGFKGSWLSIWLTYLGAKVIGISNEVLTKPSNFEIVKLKKKINHNIVDIRNHKKFHNIIKKHKPDFIFHLAAQSLVKKSYLKPKYTFETNAIGTLNLLESLKITNIKKTCSVVIITSDKSYKNLELDRGYKENDILGGYDPYSASKACAELIIQSYLKSFIKSKKNIRISVARAGNVIGGGDWSDNRLIPDCIKSIKDKKKLILRFPNSTRPWQHVLEALYGYLILAVKQKNNSKLNGSVFNFGPNDKSSITVLDLVKKIKIRLSDLNWKIIRPKKEIYESKLLKLNSKKAQNILKWKCLLNANQTLELVTSWYKYYYKNKKPDMYLYSTHQIKKYENILKNKTK
jgi:CDP-glucose 4,6-dehydratase